MSIVCILWLGAHRTVGVHVTVPSAHPVVPLPLLWLAAKLGAAMPTAAIAAAPRARRLLTFKVPPVGMASPRGVGDDAGAVLPSPLALQVLHSKFGHLTQSVRKASAAPPLCSTSSTNWARFMPECRIPCSGCRAKWSGLEVVGDPVDAAGQRLDVIRVDRREHRDPQLVAAELAVGLRVHDSVGAQHLRDRRCVDGLGEIDRADDE